MSLDYQTRKLDTKEGNLSGPIRTSHNSHTHTGNTRQPEPQLKDFSCSSTIPSHNSRDVILSHNSRNVTCLPFIPSYNSRDTIPSPNSRNTPASRSLRYHQSLVDHTHIQAHNSLSSALSLGITPKPPSKNELQTA